MINFFGDVMDMTPKPLFQNTFISRRPWIDIFPILMSNIANPNKGTIFKDWRKVKRIRNYVSKMQYIHTFLDITKFPSLSLSHPVHEQLRKSPSGMSIGTEFLRSCLSGSVKSFHIHAQIYEIFTKRENFVGLYNPIQVLVWLIIFRNSQFLLFDF